MSMRFIAVMTVVAVVGLIGCGKKKDASSLEEHYVVKKVNLRDVITQTGDISAIDNVEIKSEASGQIRKIFIKEGQKLDKGDTILIIDPTRLLTQKEKLQLSIQRAKIDLESTERDLQNGNELVKTGSVSTKKVQDLEKARALSSISLKQQMIELKDINEQLGKTMITAPISGVMTSLQVQEGEIAVSATSGFQSGTSIGTIADISKLEVITTISEVDYIHLSIGQKVMIRSEAIEGAKTKGTISFISLNAKKRNNDELATFEVRIGIDSIISGIAPGINVNVEFVILEKKDIIGVPYHFVRKQNGKMFVDIATKSINKKETITPREIVTGLTDFRNYEVVSGLKEGETVYFKIEDEGDKNQQQRGGGGGFRPH
jgi:RND family efflux transporter MFP subunit